MCNSVIIQRLKDCVKHNNYSDDLEEFVILTGDIEAIIEEFEVKE